MKLKHMQGMLSFLLVLLAILLASNSNLVSAASATKYESYQSFNHAYINIADVNINFKLGKKFHVVLPTKYHTLTFRDKNNYLYINQEDEVQKKFPKPTLTITVPNQNSIHKLNLDVDDCDHVSISGLSIKQIKLDTSNTHYDLNKVSVSQKFKISSDDSSYHFQQSQLQHLTFDDDSGRYQFANCQLDNVKTISDDMDDTHLSLNHSSLKNAQVNFDELYMKATNGAQFLGENVFNGDEMHLTLGKINPDVRLMDDDVLTVNAPKRNLIKNLKHNQSKDNRLKIEVEEGTLK